MCLIFHADGHLNIKVLSEQLWPRITDGKLGVMECYDLVFRSHTEHDLDRVYILSPQKAPPAHRVFSLLPEGDLRHCDWIFTTSDWVAGRYDKRKLGFMGSSHEAPLEFEVTRLRPRLQEAGWLTSDEGDNRYAGPFRATGMTMAEITFEDGATIREYDPDAPGETTYWLRLAFVPQIQYITDRPVAFGPPGQQPLLQVQPSCVLSPEAVLAELLAKLDAIATSRSPALAGLREDAPGTKEQVFDNLFEKPQTSTRIEDHRISLVTGPEFLVLNTGVEGDCSLLGLTLDDEKLPDRLARIWFTGANHYPFSDPLALAMEVYTYLNDFASSEVDAKTKEAISSALSCQTHDNVSHIVEALKRQAFVVSLKEGHYNVFKPDEKTASEKEMKKHTLLLQRAQGSQETDLAEYDKELRNTLYGYLPIPARGGERSRFRHKGFRIFYDIAWTFQT